jgi:hypothetical protein
MRCANDESDALVAAVTGSGERVGRSPLSMYGAILGASRHSIEVIRPLRVSSVTP